MEPCRSDLASSGTPDGPRCEDDDGFPGAVSLRACFRKRERIRNACRLQAVASLGERCANKRDSEIVAASSENCRATGSFRICLPNDSRLIAKEKTRREIRESSAAGIKRDTIYGHVTPKTKRDFYLARSQRLRLSGRVVVDSIFLSLSLGDKQ